MAAFCLGGTFKLFGVPLETKIRYTGLVIPNTANIRQDSRHSLRGIQIRQEAMQAAENDLIVNTEEEKSTMAYIIPGSPEVHFLLTTICDTTSIAEFKLNLAGFRLYVKRNLVEKKASPAPILPIVHVNTSNQTPEWNGSALAISKQITPSEGIQRTLYTAPDEGLLILQSPKVGLFRRSRTIKGMKAPPSCNEKQHVKEGQVLCYIEQFGGEIPVESDVSGEVVKILRKDGEAVGYGDRLISILPSFPGIKKLQ